MMYQLSLVSFYSRKTSEFEKILKTCQNNIFTSEIHSFFIPYQTEQIHGTLIGMETLIKESVLYNKILFHKTGKYDSINLDFFEIIISRYFPMNLRIGGFSPSNNAFLSSGKKPFERSFSIVIDSGKVVLMGWPHVNNDFNSRPLLSFREEMEIRCKIAHKYSGDNDFYLVLGELSKNKYSFTTEQSEHVVQHINAKIRSYLSQNPINITINLDDIYLVQYTDPRLPLKSTKAYRITDHWKNLSDFIGGLFNEGAD